MSLKNNATGPHGGQPILTAGEPLETAKAAMMLVHGRGASAQDILTLVEHIGAPGFAYLAPQAAQSTWYPYSFLAPMEQNQPNLDSALAMVGSALELITKANIPYQKIVIGGFSQGACLASEFAARNPQRYGGVIAFSGGLIGPPGTPRDYEGSLDGTPVFLGCSDVDFHIPKERVNESAVVFEKMGADVNEKIYPNMGHTIIEDEIIHARKIIEAVVA